MSGWRSAKIGDFLFEREGKYKPTAKEVYGLSRVHKIDFSGVFHISEKPSKTDMILIKPGDLVISGINVAKGAIGVYEGNADIAATIHYSSYSFDEGAINIEFFKRFVKSPEFVRLLKEQVKGGIKTEIKAKRLLPLTINLPSLGEQKKIADHCRRAEKGTYELSEQISNQRELLAGLRRRILQEAIEGKLTAGWRKGASRNYESAEVLLKRISQEKERLIKAGELKKQKPLPPIADNEKPFALPKGWAWCRLDDITSLYNGAVRRGPFGSTITKDIFVKEGKNTYKVYEQKNAIYKDAALGSYHIAAEKYGQLKSFAVKPGDIIISCAGTIGEVFLLPKQAKPGIINQALLRVNINNGIVLDSYFIHMFQSLTKKALNDDATGTAMKNMVSLKHLRRKNFFPIPPLAEQRAIVAKVEKLLALCDSLQAEARNNEALAKRLMQAALKEAFTPPKN